MNHDPYAASPLEPKSPSPMIKILLVLGLVGAGAGNYWQLKDRHRIKGEATVAADKVAASAVAQKELSEKIDRLESEKGTLETEKSALAAAKEELSKDVAAKTGELAQLRGTYEKLEEKMKDEIAKGDISLSQDGGKLRVGLVDKILFDSGEAAISKRGEGVLARVGAVLASIDDKQIQVSGHTDKTPISERLAAQFPSNWELSAARAINVLRFLAEKAGVPPGRLVASGYGEHHPIATNKTPAGRARNRRIEILLTPALAPKAIARAALKPAPAGVGAQARAR
jgi:chemotaxis protein MotB